MLDRGGGQVVYVVAFYSDDPSSNPAEVYNLSVRLLLNKIKINKNVHVGPKEKVQYVRFLNCRSDKLHRQTVMAPNNAPHKG